MRQTRRSFLKSAGAIAMSAPFIARHLISAPPSRILRHASFGGGGMAWADIQAICSNEFVKLVAVAEVDMSRLEPLKARFPEAKIYQDWRELLDKEGNNIDSVNVGTPDHMHAPIAMSAMQLGKHAYIQKPLAHDIHEVRRLTEVARQKNLVTQMGIQIHSQKAYRSAVALIQQGAIGKVREVHSWSGKKWGSEKPMPPGGDPIPEGFHWDLWLGVCAERPFIGNGYYHPSNWRRRLDFGTGTFGDMGCHIYDPVFEALALTAPKTVRSEGPPPSDSDWSTDAVVRYLFPGTKFTEGPSVTVTWYDGSKRPPADVLALAPVPPPPEPKSDGTGKKQKRQKGGMPDQGSIFIGTKGTMLLPHIGMPKLFPVADFKDYPMPEVPDIHHWTEWAEACVGKGNTTAGLDYSGPLTEAVLLGTIAVRFPSATLNWSATGLRFAEAEANRHVRRAYRKGWEVQGL